MWIQDPNSKQVTCRGRVLNPPARIDKALISCYIKAEKDD
jgi:hypothetical protein